MAKIILFTGPIGSGKSECADYLADKYKAIHARCKDHLVELTCKFFGISYAAFSELYHSRTRKETPHPYFKVTGQAYEDLLESSNDVIPYTFISADEYWISPRQAMILVSEHLCKPYMGEDYFGRIRAERLFEGLYVDDSLGFTEELEPTIERVGADNILIIQIHGRGDFKTDSRSMVGHPDIRTEAVYNTGTLATLLKEVDEIVQTFLQGDN